jgi:hypothetical protein
MNSGIRRVNRKTAATTIFLGFALAGCSAESVDVERMAVEANELGVVALEIHRDHQGSESVFELHGLDANGAERALVRVRTGEIADFEALPDTGRVGTEVLLSSGEKQERMITRETQQLSLDRASVPELQAFLELPTVSAVLERDAHVLVASSSARAGGEAGAGEHAYLAYSCPDYWLNTSPLAIQCCAHTMYPATIWRVTLYVASRNQFGTRRRNPQGTACRASDGVTSCSGTACFYGPNAFNSPMFTAAPTPYWRVDRILGYDSLPGGEQTPNPEKDSCSAQAYASPPGPSEFPDVTGTIPTGRGCCINGSGPCGPGLIACTSCGGGGSAGQGFWDY